MATKNILESLGAQPIETPKVSTIGTPTSNEMVQVGTSTMELARDYDMNSKVDLLMKTAQMANSFSPENQVVIAAQPHLYDNFNTKDPFAPFNPTPELQEREFEMDLNKQEYDRLVPFIDMDNLGGMQDARANNQSSYEQITRAMWKNTVNFGTSLIGGLAMLPTAIGVGFAKIGSEQVEWKDIYDNTFQNYLDSLNEERRENNMWYQTKAQEEYGLLRQMRTSRFWFDEVGHAMSFTAGAVATELAMSWLSGVTFGAGAPLQAMATTNLLAKAKLLFPTFKTVAGATESLARLGKLSGGINRGLTMARQLTTGAMYEAGVESRAFMTELDAQYAKEMGVNSIEEIPLEQRAEYEDMKAQAANAVFAANTAIVGASNFVTLPTIFNPGGRAARSKLAASVADVNGIITAIKPTKFQRILGGTWALVKKPAAEGLGEEGGQSFVSEAALEYASSRFSPEGMDTALSMGDAIKEAFEGTYGGNDKDFWKQVVIGAIVGSMGGAAAGPMALAGGDLKSIFKDTSLGEAIQVSLEEA
jgi:hypothetical protein